MTDQNIASRTAVAIPGRLDRLPLGRTHGRLLAQGGLGLMFDSGDSALIGLILPFAAAAFHLANSQLGYLGLMQFGDAVTASVGDEFAAVSAVEGP